MQETCCTPVSGLPSAQAALAFSGTASRRPDPVQAINPKGLRSWTSPGP